MKTLFYPILLLTIFFTACQREIEPLDEPDQEEQIDPGNPSSVSKAIKVWHGVRTQGSPPSSNNNPNGPVLDPGSDNQEIQAIAGRYAIIFPAPISGEVAGYYVSVTGANEYWKVDYTKPRVTERRPVARRLNAPNSALRMDTVSVIDSAIVILIPANIQPGDFCITYWAYDSVGNVSNDIQACITISQFGGDASTNFLSGTWRFDAERWDSVSSWEPYDYSSYLSIDTLYCNPDTSINGYWYDWVCLGQSCNSFVDTTYYSATSKDDMIFGSNGGLRYEYLIDNKEIVEEGPVCGNAPMIDMGYHDLIDGAWSYTASGSKLILIFDLNQWGYPEPEFYEFKLLKETDTQIILEDEWDGYQYRLKKQ